MTKRIPKKKMPRTRGFQGSTAAKKPRTNVILIAVGGVMVLGLLTFGMVRVLGFGQEEIAPAQAAIQVDSARLQSTSIEEGQNQASVAQPVDQESQYLGLDSDPETLQLAEVGKVGKPTLVWFHADW